MDELKNLAKSVLGEGLAIRKLKCNRIGSDYKIEVELDGLTHPTGSVSIGQCEQFSRSFSNAVDQWVADSSIKKSTELEEITAENYLLEVSSAGATREIELPQELERFKGMPLKLKYTEDGVYHGITVIYIEKKDDRFCFEPYVSKREKKKKKADGTKLELTEQSIIKANLFLDV